jgi:hypothetical protein
MTQINSAATSAKSSAKSSKKRDAKPVAKPRKRRRAKVSVVWYPSALNPRRKPRGKPFETGNAYRWRDGQSGNPAGTHGPTLSTKLKEMLSQSVPPDAEQAVSDLIAEGASFADMIAFIAGLNALNGDPNAAAFIRDSTEGAPDQHILLTDLTADDLARAKAKAQAWEAEHAPAAPPPPNGAAYAP